MPCARQNNRSVRASIVRLRVAERQLAEHATRRYSYINIFGL